MPQYRNLEEKFEKSERCFKNWSSASVSIRRDALRTLSSRLQKEKIYIASAISEEIGKPIKQSIAEVEKSIKCVDYYVSEIGSLSKSVDIPTEASYSGYKVKPLGLILGIMPWNYPLWQVIRFAIPAISAGNVIMLRHSSNVPNCAYIIESLFMRSELPDHIYQKIDLPSNEIGFLIGDKRIKGVSFTGGVTAGRSVGSIAGKYLKKTVLELGGSDPFVVFDDADINLAVKGAVEGRFLNNGQSCISAKRFIIHKNVYKDFLDLFQREIESLKVGDPLDKNTEIGPMISEEAVDTLDSQIKTSVEMGAKILFGGELVKDLDQRTYLPTLVSNVTLDMPLFREETFGPVAPVTSFESVEEAIAIANFSQYGLGCSIWTEDLERAGEIGTKIESGNIFINSIVKSDPRLPFGGVKESGYGKELGKPGFLEFTNLQTWWVK